MNGTPRDQMHDAFGDYVRSQRQLARMTLRQAAELASISNPYLSQIEHGLARPSIAVVSALAEALSVSAESLLLMAAGLGVSSPTSTAGISGQTEAAIRQDSRLGDGQKAALLAVLASFVDPPPLHADSSSVPVDPPLVPVDPPVDPTSATPPAKAAASMRSGTGRHTASSRKPASTSGTPAAAGSRPASRKKVSP